MADVVVFGIDNETVPLYDIQMDVPHQCVVTIPEDKAHLSKDLWRAISQRRLFRLGPDTNPNTHKFLPTPPPMVPSTKADVLTDRVLAQGDEIARLEGLLTQEQEAKKALLNDNRSLLEENAVLRTKVESLEATLNDQGKLDEILTLLRTKPVVLTVSAQGTDKATGKSSGDLVEVETPTFVPSEIKRDDLDTRVEVRSETSKGGSVAGATSALRKLKQER